MTSLTAAELRRQKILQNREERIKLLIGVKNGETNSSSLSSPSSSESLTKLNSSIETASPNANNNNNSNKPFTAPKLSVHEDNRDFLSTETNENNDDDEIFAPSEKRRDSKSKSLRFLNFNGHTNVEILILSSLALLTCLSLHFKIDYIYRNALLPFFTFELAHLIVHLKYLPSMSSQFQVFRTLLQLCGISPKSRNNLMIFINFLYILIDNFVIYIFSFVCIFFFMDLSRRIYL